MGQIPLGIGAYSRPFGKLPEIRMENRFFEQNPVGAERVALLSRPGSKLFRAVGTGPIRAMHSQAGVFNEDLFIVSGQDFFRYDGVNPELQITGVIAGANAVPVMTTIAIPNWEAIFITDGETLQYYEGEGHATGMITSGGPASPGDVVHIGSFYYKFTAASIEAGPPDGSVGTPWLIPTSATADPLEELTNLFNAINLLGIAGTDYSLGTLINPDVTAYDFQDSTLTFKVRANVGGVGGNAIVTTAAATFTWTGATLSGGGGHDLKTSNTNGVIFTDLTTLAGFIVGAEANSRRFYWIRPGEVDVDPLDFSSAEAEPDNIVNIAAVGDQLWIFGQSSTEVWYASGDSDQPFLRNQGRAFSQGIIPGTFAKINDTIIVIGQDRVAYRIAGVPQRISNHGIEERIRLWQESLVP